MIRFILALISCCFIVIGLWHLQYSLGMIALGLIGFSAVMFLFGRIF